MANLSDFVPNLMLKGTEYSNKSDNPYTFTASMIGNEVLQNYLTVVNGTFPTQKVDDTTIGSIFHRGMEEIIKEQEQSINDILLLGTEQNLQRILDNGWTLSGTADLKFATNLESDFNLNIHDFKLTKMYAIGKIREDLSGHNYTKQLNILKYLDYWERIESLAPIPTYNLVIDAFAKDAKAIQGEEIHHAIEVPEANNDVIEAEILQKTNELQQYIESGEIPPACEDVWPRRMRNGTTINTRCTFYCSHGKSGKCPYFNPNTRQTVARISNW